MVVLCCSPFFSPPEPVAGYRVVATYPHAAASYTEGFLYRDGRVLGWIDLAGLLPDSERVNAESVLNGIAYDAEHNRIFVTGKQWPKVFEIEVVPK